MLAVLGAVALAAACAESSPLPVLVPYWAEVGLPFVSGVPGSTRLPVKVPTGRGAYLPRLSIGGCASCVAAKWVVDGAYSDGNVTVDARADVAIEFRYSGERRRGAYVYQLILETPGGAEWHIPLRVSVHGPWLDEMVAQRSRVAGSNAGVRIPLPGVVGDVDVIPAPRAGATKWVHCTSRSRDGASVWFAPVAAWETLNQAVLELQPGVAADRSQVDLRVVGLPPFDVSPTVQGDDAAPAVRLRSRVPATVRVRIAPAGGGDGFTPETVLLSPHAELETRLRGLVPGASSTVRVTCHAPEYERIVPVRW